MHVVTLINGSLISETSSIYALHYAKVLNFTLHLVHIKGKDNLSEVQRSADDLHALAQKHEVETKFAIFDTLNEFIQFITQKEIDMIFCSTRHNRTFLDPSFVQILLKKRLSVDFAVVKVLKASCAENIESLVVPIRNSRFSVKKFTLFSTLALAYGAKAEVYSIDKVSKSDLASVSKTVRLKQIIFDLRHYFRLANLMKFKFSLKHDFALKEGKMVLAHIGGSNYDLVIVGAHTSSSFLFSHPIDVVFDHPLVNTIYFVPYEKR